MTKLYAYFLMTEEIISNEPQVIRRAGDRGANAAAPLPRTPRARLEMHVAAHHCKQEDTE